MFSLSEQTAKIRNLNLRAELHGEDHKIACDIHFEIKVSNNVLNDFDQNLKAALYRAAEDSDNTGNDLFKDEPGYLPKLKFPLLGALKWNWKNAGYAVTVHYGISGKADIFMPHSQVDRFKFDCQDGGTVVVHFRVIAHPESDDLGRLSEMIQQECTLSMEPPSVEDMLKMDMADADSEDD